MIHAVFHCYTNGLYCDGINWIIHSFVQKMKLTQCHLVSLVMNATHTRTRKPLVQALFSFVRMSLLFVTSRTCAINLHTRLQYNYDKSITHNESNFYSIVEN